VAVVAVVAVLAVVENVGRRTKSHHVMLCCYVIKCLCASTTACHYLYFDASCGKGDSLRSRDARMFIKSGVVNMNCWHGRFSCSF